MRIKLVGIFIVMLSLIFSPNAFAYDAQSLQSEVSQLKVLVSELTKTVEKQNVKIVHLENALQGRSSSTFVPVVNRQDGVVRSTPKWTPEIGVVADITANFDSPKEDGEGADRVSVRELELIFGSEVDPYSRFDATIGFSDFEEASLEEAYLTHFALPWDITGRFGKFKPKVGKALPLHRDSLDTVDYPLVLERWFGSHGYNKAGVDLTRGFDVVWPLPQEVTFGVLEGGNGEGGTLFGEARRRPTIYTHAETYIDLSDSTGLELGVSHLAGSRDADPSLEVQVVGADATLRHAIDGVRAIKLQGEAFFQHRQETRLDEPVDEDTGVPFLFDDELWGAYALLDVRLSQRWSAGVRYDYVELSGEGEHGHEDEHEEEEEEELFTLVGEPDEGITAYLTFHQSEFARWRVQYSHLDLANGQNDNRVILQGTFAIGEHKHKIN